MYSIIIIPQPTPTSVGVKDKEREKRNMKSFPLIEMAAPEMRTRFQRARNILGESDSPPNSLDVKFTKKSSGNMERRRVDGRGGATITLGAVHRLY